MMLFEFNEWEEKERERSNNAGLKPERIFIALRKNNCLFFVIVLSK